MGYSCPVCGTPQADGEHLANHLAITGLLHDGDHAAWLDERVEGWADRSPEALAETVTEHAEAIDAEPVTEGGDAPTFEGDLARRGGAGRTPSDEVADVLEEARELTGQMYEREE